MPLELTAVSQIPINVTSGICTGVTIAALFHPWDRASFLAVTNNRPFIYDGLKNRFVAENFTQPYHGVTQSIIYRTIANGLYFVAQRQLSDSLYPYLHNQMGLHEWQAQFIVGLSAGSISGIGTNSFSAIRSQTWINPGSTFVSSTKIMWGHGGIKPFMKGISATVGRQTTFGVIYEVLRHSGTDPNKKSSLWQFAQNAGAAGVATLFAGPFNYVRNKTYATPPNQQPPNAMKLLSDVWHDSKAKTSLPSRAGFFLKKFQIGSGTARVAVGMAAGQEIFEKIHSGLVSSYENDTESKQKKL